MNSGSGKKVSRLSCWSLLTALASVSGLIVVKSLVVTGTSSISKWLYTPWLFDYSHGFVKRGLLGELLRLLSIERSRPQIFLLSLIVLLVVAAVLFAVYTLPVRKAREKLDGRRRDGLRLFALFAVTSPATLSHFALDVGRFDHVLLLLAALSVYGVHRWGRVSALIVVLISGGVGLLVHEIYAVAFLPLVIAYWFYRNPGNRAFRITGLLPFAVLLLSVPVLVLLGTPDQMTQRQYLSALRASFDGVAEGSVAVLYRGLPENVAYTTHHLLSIDSLQHHLVFAVVMAPALYVLAVTVRTLVLAEKGMPDRLGLILVVAASVSPLLLYPVGLDAFRWWALAITNLLASLAVLSHKERLRKVVGAVFWRLRYVTLVAIILGLILGPLEDDNSFRLAVEFQDGLRALMRGVSGI